MNPLALNMQAWLAIAIGVAAMADDLKRRHIANWIPAAALAGGMGWQMGLNGWHGALTGLAGTVVGFAVFLAFYLLGGMGGGDVKLMAGFGALLGPGGLLQAALWTAAFGGVMAVGALAWQKLRSSTSPSTPQKAGQKDSDSIPYAPAIALGVWMSLLA
jgi:prepilin peptidase CpaA